MAIIVNQARCRKCNTTIESKYTHDFVRCPCGAIAVDGGKSYLKRMGHLEDCEELSVETHDTSLESILDACSNEY